MPQIANMVQSQSSKGVSLASYVLETIGFIITLAYNYRLDNPFSSYGEGAFVTLQNAVVMLLILRYTNKTGLLVVGAPLYAALAVGLFWDQATSMQTLALLQWGTILLGVASKLPQIYSNLRQGSTGQLSAITTFLQFAGTVARVFTSVQEGLDAAILTSFAVMTLLNGILLAQIVYYRNETRSNRSKRSKKGV